MDPVIETDASTAATSQDSGQAGDKDKPKTVTISQAELDALRRDRDEARQSERTWASLFQQNARRPEGGAGEETNDDDLVSTKDLVDPNLPDGTLEGDNAEKMVADLAAQGVQAIKKRGFITAKDAQEIAVEAAKKVARVIVDNERAKITTDTQILTQFPDLKDNTSEMFKLTGEIYRAAIAMDPSAKKTPAALFLAAQAAKAQIDAKGRSTRQNVDEHEDNGEETEEDRQARVASQGGRGRAREAVDDNLDMVGPEAKEILRQMGVKEQDFITERKATVHARPRGRR